jgi:hypothetical protein
VFGWRADASAGLTFGPYPIQDFNPAYDYSGSISAGIFSIEGSVGKDGVGGALELAEALVPVSDKVKIITTCRRSMALAVPNSYPGPSKRIN